MAKNRGMRKVEFVEPAEREGYEFVYYDTGSLVYRKIEDGLTATGIFKAKVRVNGLKSEAEAGLLPPLMELISSVAGDHTSLSIENSPFNKGFLPALLADTATPARLRLAIYAATSASVRLLSYEDALALGREGQERLEFTERTNAWADFFYPDYGIFSISRGSKVPTVDELRAAVKLSHDMVTKLPYSLAYERVRSGVDTFAALIAASRNSAHRTDGRLSSSNGLDMFLTKQEIYEIQRLLPEGHYTLDRDVGVAVGYTFLAYGAQKATELIVALKHLAKSDDIYNAYYGLAFSRMEHELGELNLESVLRVVDGLKDFPDMHLSMLFDLML